MLRLRSILLSLAVHVVVLLAVWTVAPGLFEPRKPVALPPTVKIRIIETRAEAPPPPKTAPAKAAPRRAPRAVPKASVPERKAERYEDLFPSYAASPAHTPATAEATDSPAGTFDPEGDAIPVAEQNRNLNELETFARGLAERLSIPDSVKALTPRGRATLRLERRATGWHVAAVTGEPYYRSILFETLAALPPRGYLFTLLDATTYQSVRIAFTLTPVSSLDTMAKPVSVSTRSNQVLLAVTHKHVDDKWQLLGAIDNAEGDDAVGANLIGVGQLLWDRFHQSDPAEDLDAKRLRLSPAFVRPIGR